MEVIVGMLISTMLATMQDELDQLGGLHDDDIPISPVMKARASLSIATLPLWLGISLLVILGAICCILAVLGITGRLFCSNSSRKERRAVTNQGTNTWESQDMEKAGAFTVIDEE